MSTKADPTEKAVSQNSIVLKLCLQNLVNKHTIDVPPVSNGLKSVQGAKGDCQACH